MEEEKKNDRGMNIERNGSNRFSIESINNNSIGRQYDTHTREPELTGYMTHYVIEKWATPS